MGCPFKTFISSSFKPFLTANGTPSSIYFFSISRLLRNSVLVQYLFVPKIKPFSPCIWKLDFFILFKYHSFNPSITVGFSTAKALIKGTTKHVVDSVIGGMFLCIPGWHMGCELSHLNDIFWNRESISRSDESFGYENATAIAYALKELNELVG